MDESLFVFVDLEASGLHPTAYPIEVGWASLDLKPQSFLINPHLTWPPDDWSYESERIHRITQADLDIKGLSVNDAVARLNEAWAGKILFSDAPELDGRWLAMLYRAAGSSPKFPFPLMNGWELIRSALRERHIPTDLATMEEYEKAVDARFPRPHRAGPDALHLAALYRAAKGYDQ